MYDIQFVPQLNTVDWTFTGAIRDASTNEDLDLSIYTWTFEILEPNGGSVRLTASTSNGKFTTPDLGVFQFTFTDAEMGTLCPKTYDTRLTMELDDQSAALSVGPLPVVDR
jgi:hypothetical protein